MRAEATEPADVVDAALIDAHSRYRYRTTTSRDLYERAVHVMPGGNTRTTLFFLPYPLTMVRGAGCYLWDADGRRYVDFLGDYSAGLFGHSDPVIRSAIVAALDEGLSLSAHNRREAELAELICSRIPSLEKLRFTNSGTEANIMALSAATAFTKRRKILVFEGAYHGGVLSFATRGLPLNVPHEFLYARYNDLDSATAAIEAHANEIAAVLVEPMLGSGGCIPGDNDFLRGLWEATRRVGALLIFDEVMTSRLAPGGYQSRLQMAPDLTTLGKYIGGGLSCGAFGGREDIMAMFDPRRANALPHAGTFNNNVLSMAAGVAALGKVLTQATIVELNQRGDTLRQKLNDIFTEHEAPFQFTGIGSLMNFHPRRGRLRSARDVALSDQRWRDLYFHHLIDSGIYIAPRGYVALMLEIGDPEIEMLLAATDAFVSRYRDLLKNAAKASNDNGGCL